jgi:peptidylprolyl isomerase
VAAAPADAQVTASGLASKVLTPGTGTEHPTATDQVKVHYTGWTTDGKMFDSSVARGRPVVLPLSKVIAGWTEGVQLMVVGEKRRLWIPAKLAYETKPEKPQGTLVFDVELLDILRVPPTPSDVAAPPADAEKLPSGLAWKVLKPGTGTLHPKASSTVRVHYTGWTTDGQMFDSSLKRGTPSTFELTKVIAGWTDVIQRMTEGETRRVWIPSRQAYDGAPGKPRGMLVFEITLLEIVRE